MYILGINMHSHDSSAVLMKNGKILFAVEEERLNRVKHYRGFPTLAIKACLEYAKITLDDVDVLACDWITSETRKKRIKRYIDNNFFVTAATEISYLNPKVSDITIKKVVEENKLKGSFKIDYYDHHFCHAASAFFPSKLEDSLVLTADARGFLTTASLWQGMKIKLSLIKEYTPPFSTGYTYKYITKLCGFGRYSEGTTMALAPFGKSVVSDKLDFLNPLMNKWIDLMELYDSQKIRPIIDEFVFLDKAYSLLSEPEKNQIDNIASFSKENLAASVQQWLEDKILFILKKYRNDNKNISLAGGTFFNCTLNSKIKEQFDNIFIQPAAGDAGIALGAAILSNNNKCDKMNHVYFGPEFSNDYIESLLEKRKLKYEKSNYKHAAELLQKNKIIGWFQSRMEFGPRALGNRSILANPRFKKNKDLINLKIKERDTFRPFAPSVLKHKMKEYFHEPYDCPFMNISFKAKDEKLKEIPAVLHVDNTSRVQTVNELNGKYHNLINYFYKLTNIPLLLNTSFNRKAEAIVCKPEEALDAFFDKPLDYLFLGDYVVYKNEKKR
jgi:carbamoyltransferase